jgi:metal-sulfur cluster biosynthetic enzyme
MDEKPIQDSEAPYPYAGPPELKAPIETALRQVVDPEVALSIVDVGLVYAVTVTELRVHVKMTMTSAACPVTDVILADVEDALDGVLPPGYEIRVELVWDPPWGTERMSARAKAFMGW